MIEELMKMKLEREERETRNLNLALDIYYTYDTPPALMIRLIL